MGTRMGLSIARRQRQPAASLQGRGLPILRLPQGEALATLGAGDWERLAPSVPRILAKRAQGGSTWPDHPQQTLGGGN